GSVGSQSMPKYTCVSLSTHQVNIRNLVSYQRQKVPVNAVMFITARGIKFCVSPDQKWAQAAMKRIDERRATRGK
ncbi:XCL1 protein, partial [Turnix velox]|nr:XCL1 protein [Turnix velox]